MTQNKKKRTQLFVVLDDGETFSCITGAKIVEVTERVADAMHNDHKYEGIADGSYDDEYPNLSKGCIREINLDELPGL